MSPQECPRCGALLTHETKGDLLDKILLCGHCGFERDVLDEVTIQQEEAGKKVTVHRKDLGSHDVSSEILGDSDMQAKIREMTGIDMAELMRSAESVQSSGKTITQTTTTTTNFSGAAAEQKIAELGLDLGQLVHDAQVRAGNVPDKPSGNKGLAVSVGVMLLLAVLGAMVWLFAQPAS